MTDETAPPFDSRGFRNVLGCYPTGVTVVTACRADGEPAGLTANSFTSVSLDPPLILVCIDHGAASHDAILESGAFAVNILPDRAEGVSKVFAGKDRDDRFRNLAWRQGDTGSPILDDAVAWLDCRVHQTHVAGDHTIVVGRVVALEGREGAPLVYHRGRYARIAEG